MIALLNGKQGSGKTTTADAVAAALVAKGFHVKRLRFAQPLYEMHDAVQLVLKKYGIVRPEIDGPLLQILGTEYGRNIIGVDVWVNCIKNAIKDYQDHLQTMDEVIYLIDDLRFCNEFDAFPDGFKTRLNCDRDTRKERRGTKWRDNENHASEIDLDNRNDFFDFRIDTGITPFDQVVEEVSTRIQIMAQTKTNKAAISDALGEENENP